MELKKVIENGDFAYIKIHLDEQFHMVWIQQLNALKKTTKLKEYICPVRWITSVNELSLAARKSSFGEFKVRL